MDQVQAELRRDIHLFQTEYDTKAFNRLYEHHRKLLYKIQNESQFTKYNLPAGDIESEINYGYIKALQGFDLNRQNNVQTYLSHYVRGIVKDYLRRHAPMFGKRFGAGSLENLTNGKVIPLKTPGACVDSDTGEEWEPTRSAEHREDLYPATHSQVEQCMICDDIDDMLYYVLDETEGTVVRSFFGIGEDDEATWNESRGKRDDDPVYRNGEYSFPVAEDDRKLRRIANKMGLALRETKRVYESAMAKLRDSEDLAALLGQYQSVNNLYFSEAMQ